MLTQVPSQSIESTTLQDLEGHVVAYKEETRHSDLNGFQRAIDANQLIILMRRVLEHIPEASKPKFEQYIEKTCAAVRANLLNQAKWNGFFNQVKPALETIYRKLAGEGEPKERVSIVEVSQKFQDDLLEVLRRSRVKEGLTTDQIRKRLEASSDRDYGLLTGQKIATNLTNLRNQGKVSGERVPDKKTIWKAVKKKK